MRVCACFNLRVQLVDADIVPERKVGRANLKSAAIDDKLASAGVTRGVGTASQSKSTTLNPKIGNLC